MERERYPEIWETIEEKLDKVCEENANPELILIGGYNRAELAFGRPPPRSCDTARRIPGRHI